MSQAIQNNSVGQACPNSRFVELFFPVVFIPWRTLSTMQKQCLTARLEHVSRRVWPFPSASAFAYYNLAMLIHAVSLKKFFCQVNANCRSLHLRRSSSVAGRQTTITLTLECHLGKHATIPLVYGLNLFCKKLDINKVIFPWG